MSSEQAEAKGELLHELDEARVYYYPPGEDEHSSTTGSAELYDKWVAVSHSRGTKWVPTDHVDYIAEP